MIELMENDIDNVGIASPVSIKLLGIGGAGGNAVNSVVESGYSDIEAIVANTDVQALNLSLAQNRIQIGVKSTKGLGSGANPDIGERAAQEDLEKIMQTIGDADIVFLAAGMGGGTGSGAIPVIAQALRDKGVLSIAIVTKPFAFEGKKRAKVAVDAIDRLKKVVDTLIIMPNQKLLEVTDKQISMIDAFAMMNRVLGQSVRSIADIVTKPGHINVDFADVRAIMKDRGLAVMGTGTAAGECRANKAALQAISSPLLENMSITGARGILFNITGGNNLGLHEINEAASVIYQEAHEDANIIVGSVIDESLTDEVHVTIIATGFEPQDISLKEPDKKNLVSTIQEKSSDLLSEQAVRAAHELVEALKAETERITKVSTQPAQRDDGMMQAIVQEVLKEVQRAEKLVTQSAATTLALTEDAKEQVKNDVALIESVAVTVGQESILHVKKEDGKIDFNDLDVPTYLRHSASQEQK